MKLFKVQKNQNVTFSAPLTPHVTSVAVVIMALYVTSVAVVILALPVEHFYGNSCVAHWVSYT